MYKKLIIKYFNFNLETDDCKYIIKIHSNFMDNFLR